jgi:hypothetical protein
VIEDHEARTGGTLIYRANVTGHRKKSLPNGCAVTAKDAAPADVTHVTNRAGPCEKGHPFVAYYYKAFG